MRRLEPHPGFSPGSSTWPEGGAQIQDRWESLLGKAPRLRPWLSVMLQRRRVVLAERLGNGAREEIDRVLCDELARWLTDFEALPHYAVSAIALDLSDEPLPRTLERPAEPGAAEPSVALDARAGEGSPESAVCEFEALLADPAFALAFHCVDARVRPRLESATRARSALSRIPEPVWLGLLHASVPPTPRLTARVAIGLVLRMQSIAWAELPASSRKAALRLFHAGPLEVRSFAEVPLCEALPRAWELSPASLGEFVAVSAQARSALADACGLCARLVALALLGCQRNGAMPLGGLALLHEDGTVPASGAEAREVTQTARKFGQMTGFATLLELLRGTA